MVYYDRKSQEAGLNRLLVDQGLIWANGSRLNKSLVVDSPTLFELQMFHLTLSLSLSGASFAFMLRVFQNQIPLDECKEIYLTLGSDIFKRNVIVEKVKLGWSHTFCSTSKSVRTSSSQSAQSCSLQSSLLSVTP